MKTMTQLISLALGLAVTTPVFAHDVRDHDGGGDSPSSLDRPVARSTNVSFSEVRVARDGRLSRYEVRRLEEQRRRELFVRCEREAARARYFARMHAEAESRHFRERPASWR
jgi:hypothetical protein